MPVHPLPLTAARARDLVRHALAASAGRVALLRRVAGGEWRQVVTLRQVEMCLRHCEVIDTPDIDQNGHVRCTLYRQSAGVEVWVRVAINKDSEEAAWQLLITDVMTRP